MSQTAEAAGRPLPGVVLATGEAPVFQVGQRVRVLVRRPVGHYRVPTYLRGKTAVVEAVIKRPGLNNEEEAFGRNAGDLRHYYRLALAMSDVWPAYSGSPNDGLRIEVFETWLERAEA
jgi:nitrile hydratase